MALLLRRAIFLLAIYGRKNHRKRASQMSLGNLGTVDVNIVVFSRNHDWQKVLPFLDCRLSKNTVKYSYFWSETQREDL